MDFSITVPLDPSAEHRDTILAGLADFNAEEAGPSGGTPLAIMLSDGRGADQGGLWGTAIYDWLHIELLFVPRRLRGRSIGTELMTRAEAIALDRGCVGVWLDTFSFQSRGFYEKLGYAVVGMIQDHPLGGARYFMQKRLVPPLGCTDAQRPI